MSEKEHIIRADVLAARISEMRKLVDTLEKDQKKYAAPVLAKVEGFKVPKPGDREEELAQIKVTVDTIKEVAAIGELIPGAGPAVSKVVQAIAGVASTQLDYAMQSDASRHSEIMTGFENLMDVQKMLAYEKNSYDAMGDIDKIQENVKEEARLYHEWAEQGLQEDVLDKPIEKCRNARSAAKNFFNAHYGCNSLQDGLNFAAVAYRFAVYVLYMEMFLTNLTLNNIGFKERCDRERSATYEFCDTMLKGMTFYEMPNEKSHFRMAGLYNLGRTRLEFINTVLFRDEKKVNARIVSIQCYGDRALVCKRPDKPRDEDRSRVLCKRITDYSKSETKFVMFQVGQNNELYGRFPLEVQRGSDKLVTRRDQSGVYIFSIGGCGYLFSSSSRKDCPWVGIKQRKYEVKPKTENNVDDIKGVMCLSKGAKTDDSTWRIGRDPNSDSLHWFTNEKHQLNLMALSPKQDRGDKEDDENHVFTCNDWRLAQRYKHRSRFSPGPGGGFFLGVEDAHVEIIWDMKKLE